MRRDTQAVLLLLVGGTLLKVSIAGTYVRYVKPGLLPLLLISAIVLLAVAGVTLWRHLQAAMPARGPGRPPHDIARSAHDSARTLGGAGQHERVEGSERAAAAGRAAAEHEGLDTTSDSLPAVVDEDHTDEEVVEAHDHDHDRSRIGWLLLIPALALLLFSPPALGSFQASRNGTAISAGSTSDFAPLAAGDPVRVSLLDYASRAVFDQGRSLTGRTVLLTGFVIAGPHGEPYLARLFVGCCAADARPIKVGLGGALPGDLKPDQWVEVTGRYSNQVDKDTVNGEIIPYVTATSIRDITPPEEQYET